MQKQKKFIALAIVVFLAFLALGKYKQSTALASADVLYTTEVRDKKRVRPLSLKSSKRRSTIIVSKIPSPVRFMRPKPKKRKATICLSACLSARGTLSSDKVSILSVSQRFKWKTRTGMNRLKAPQRLALPSRPKMELPFRRTT